jgi:DNA-binding protein YbaB
MLLDGLCKKSITKKYLIQSKELLEVKLTLAVKEAKKQLQENNQQNKEETKANRANSIIRPCII